MLPIRPTSRFKKDLKMAAKQRRNIKELHHVLEQLALPAPLLPKHKDRKLQTSLSGQVVEWLSSCSRLFLYSLHENWTLVEFRNSGI